MEHDRQTEIIDAKPSAVDDRPVNAGEVAQMHRWHYVWQCPACEHRMRFRATQSKVVAWFVVRHLLALHRVRPDRVIAVEPALTEFVHEYCRQMGK